MAVLEKTSLKFSVMPIYPPQSSSVFGVSGRNFLI